MKRFLSLILAVVLILVSVLSGCTPKKGTTTSNISVPTDAVPINVHKAFEPLYGGSDSYLYDNPDRGYRTEYFVQIYRDKPKNITAHMIFLDDSDETVREKIEYLWTKVYFKSRMEYKSRITILYLSISDFEDDPVLPERFFEIMEIYFDICRKYKVKCMPRISYHGLRPTATLSGEAYQEKLKEVCATEEIMLAHIDQMAPLIAENIDVIHKISSGFIGSGGEMVELYQNPPVSYSNVMKAIVEKLCVPNGIYYTTRLPKYKIQFMEEEPDWPYFDYIGFNNDGIFGEQTVPGKVTGCWQKDHNGTKGEVGCPASNHTANDWWEYVCQTGAYTPQSGEMFVNSFLIDPSKGKYYCPVGLEVVLECAHFRYTSMSQYHTIGETAGDSAMARWIANEKITPEWCEENGIIYDPAWFVNADGEEIRRNPYEFLRDFLGYKIVAQSVDITGNVGKSSVITVDTTLKNYGFAAAFNLKSGYAILDENYNLVSKVEAGEPNKWYSHDPDNYKSTVVLEHHVKADITLPAESGRYYIALYIMSNNGEGAALSNGNIDFQNEYNILYGIEF